MKNFDIKKQTENCIAWIQDYFDNKSGNAKGVIVGISGGKDSAVVVGLLCKAIGKEKVFGVLIPNGEQKDIEDSKKICKCLGIRYLIVNIENVYEEIIDSIYIELTDQSKINIPARIRMTILYAIGSTMNYRICGTGNASEAYVGYCTKYGDSACDFNPIANFITDEVIAIGDYLGLPYDIVHKTPCDGLCGKSDEDNLGFTYAELNEYINTGKCINENIKTKIDNMHIYSRHKFDYIPTY
jgi:NAD+ synthase